MEIKKVIKQYGFLRLVKTENILGGEYAIINGDRAKTGLTLDAAKDLFRTLRQLTR